MYLGCSALNRYGDGDTGLNPSFTAAAANNTYDFQVLLCCVNCLMAHLTIIIFLLVNLCNFRFAIACLAI